MSYLNCSWYGTGQSPNVYTRINKQYGANLRIPWKCYRLPCRPQWPCCSIYHTHTGLCEGRDVIHKTGSRRKTEPPPQAPSARYRTSMHSRLHPVWMNLNTENLIYAYLVTRKDYSCYTQHRPTVNAVIEISRTMNVAFNNGRCVGSVFSCVSVSVCRCV